MDAIIKKGCESEWAREGASRMSRLRLSVASVGDRRARHILVKTSRTSAGERLTVASQTS
jgi:hypothetical protein